MSTNSIKLIQSNDELISLNPTDNFNTIRLSNFDYKSFKPDDFNKILNATITVSDVLTLM